MSDPILEDAAMELRLAPVERAMMQLAAGHAADALGPIVQEHLATGGKRLRARLALAATLTLGGSEEAAMAWATACELAHNATLIHDDVQDGDVMRRGHPTTWVRHGVAQAINAGDLLFMLPVTALHAAALPAPISWRLCVALSHLLATVIRGQALECNLLPQGHTDRPTYEAMIRGKTSALFELPVYGAAVISGANDAQAAALTAPFASLGMLFQMQDDVLDLYGDKGRGAPGADLREGKVSALVVEHLERQPHERPWLLDLLRTPREQTTDSQVQDAIERFRRSGALAGVLARIAAHAQQAQAHSASALAPVLAELVTLVRKPIAHL